MKINNLLENITPTSNPDQGQGSQAPHFGRSDKFLEQKVDENNAGAIASVVATPVGKVQRRGKGSMLQGIKTSAKYPNSAAVKESINRGGYNPLRSKEDYLDKREHLHSLLNTPGLNKDDRDIIRQRLQDLEAIAKKAGLSERQVNEVNPQNFGSDEDYYDAVNNQGKQQFSGDWDVWDEIASLENQIKYSNSEALRYQLYKQIDQLKRDNGIEDEEDEYEKEYDAGLTRNKGVTEADEWEEEGDKFQRFLAYAQKQLQAADRAQRLSLAKRLSMWQVKHFGPENNQTYNPNTGAAIQGNNDITPSIRAILEIVNRTSGNMGFGSVSAPQITSPQITSPQQVEIDNRWRLTDEGKQWLEYAREELEKVSINSSEFIEVAKALSQQQQEKFGRAQINDIRNKITVDVSRLMDQVKFAASRAEQQASFDSVNTALEINELIDRYNDASPEEKAAFAAGVKRDYGMSVNEFFDYLETNGAAPTARRQPSPADDVFAEAKKANTKTARKEFGARVKKPTLSDKEQEKKKSDSDKLWDMLQAHIAAAEKDKEVKEANSFLKPGPATTGKFPEPRKPSFSGDQGSKSETLGRDGLIYHWQDPRAKQGVAEGSPQSMGTALTNALSKVEPGSKLDKKIRHHNDMVRRFGPEAGTMTSAPDGYRIDKKGFIRLGQGVAEGSKYKCSCHPGDPDPDCPVHGLEPMDVGDALDVKKGMAEEKQRLDPKCWTGYKKQGTKMKGDTRVNNCVKVDEAELNETDMLAKELFKQLELFKKGADKDIGSKAKDRDISNKAKDKDIVTKEASGEYDDEAGSSESNLLTTARAVKGLIDTIDDRDNLPEWVQEKIAKAEGMLVASWDYLQSQKEQGIDPQVDEDWQKANKSDKTDGMSPKAVKAYRRENPGSKLKTAVTTKPSKLKAGSKDANRRKSFCARMSGNKGPMKDEHGKPTPKAKALNRWNC